MKTKSVQMIFSGVSCLWDLFSPSEFTHNLLDISLRIISNEVVLLHRVETEIKRRKKKKKKKNIQLLDKSKAKNALTCSSCVVNQLIPEAVYTLMQDLA